MVEAIEHGVFGKFFQRCGLFSCFDSLEFAFGAKSLWRGVWAVEEGFQDVRQGLFDGRVFFDVPFGSLKRIGKKGEIEFF